MKNIIKFFQYGHGDEDLWNLYQKIIPLGTMVIAKEVNSDDLIFKLGDGEHKYNELSEFMRFSLFQQAFKIDRFSELDASDIGNLLYLDSNKKIVSSTITKDELLDFVDQISQITLKTAVTPPIITGQTRIKYGVDLNLKAEALSAFRYTGIKVANYIWGLPNGSVTEGADITYSIPDDFGLVGDIFTFKCKAVDEIGNESDYSEFDVLIDSVSNSLIESITILN
jgi:hypothetical protein